VPATKSFTTQLTILYLMALFFARKRGRMTSEVTRSYLQRLRRLPDAIQDNLQTWDERAEKFGAAHFKAEKFLYLGRGVHYSIAREGALKLKEISYIHAEGYPAAEMKHGPIALVDEETPSVFVIPRGQIYPKIISNLEEIKARKGPVIAIACEGDDCIAERADDVIYVPDVDEFLQPLVTVVPLQLLAYHIALLRGCNVDRPRNLAKSVTVE
jgi:glucosamine--fructose-6-phosphate aminotransferase (isomerizing)